MLSIQLNTDVIKQFGTYDAPNNLLVCLARQLKADRRACATPHFRSVSLLTLMRLAHKNPYHLVPDRSQPCLVEEYPLCAWCPEKDTNENVEAIVLAIEQVVPPQTLFRKLLQRDGRIYLIGQ